MRYVDLCGFYEEVERTSKRLEMIDTFVSFLSGLNGSDAEIVIRLTKNEIGPGYEGFELGVSEKLVIKALYEVTMLNPVLINQERIRTGDIGDTAEELVQKKQQQSLFHEELTIERVYDNLKRISSSKGRSSQDQKVKLIAELFHDASPIESRYIARTLCQRMRLGSSDMTLIDSLAYLATEEMEAISKEVASYNISGVEQRHIASLRSHSIIALNQIIDRLSSKERSGLDKECLEKARNRIMELRETIKRNREEIVKTYNIHPDLAYLTKEIILYGMDGVKEIEVEPGIPLRSMLAERSSTMEDIIQKLEGRAALEYKYDGLRMQVHVHEDGRIELFSRQLENITLQFPDIVEKISSSIEESTAIVEGECVPIERSTGKMLPFQVISKRRGRKHDLDMAIEDIPVVFVVFDCLYINGSSYIDRTYLSRRKAILDLFPKISEEIDPEKKISISRMEIFDDSEKALSFFENALEDGSEGIMAKSIGPGSNYQAGSRGWQWIKFKKDYRSGLNDTLDLVVVGGFHGSGRRGGYYGAYLMAVFDSENDRFQTICKLGSGFNDEQLMKLTKELGEHILSRDGIKTRVDLRIEPEVYFEPYMVLEVIGAEITYSPNHTCAMEMLMEDHGLAIRFPRFTGRFRYDKSPDQATTVKEMISMYKLQKRTI